jgi:hypothetical protein
MTTQELHRFDNLEEVISATVELRDEIALSGAPDVAQQLTDVLDCFYTTSSEALGEIRKVLTITKPMWENLISARYRLLGEHAISEATRLLGMRS